MNEQVIWHIENGKEALAEQVANVIASALIKAISNFGNAQLFVSGGQSPVPFFHALAKISLDWKKVTVALVDERCVPHNHTDSNTALVKQHLLIHQAANANWNDIVDTMGIPVNQPLAPAHHSIAVLGMGEDGHTASLFPDAANIQTALNLLDAPQYLTVEPKHAPHKRISLSARALTKFAHLFVLIQGEKKRIVLEKALSDANAAHPIGFVINHADCCTDIYWSP